MESRKAALLLFIVVLATLANLPTPVHAWSIQSHQIVVKHAIDLLPEPWMNLFRYYQWLLNDSTAYPDTYYRESDPDEPPRHFIDLEIWNPNDPSTGTLPQAVVEFTSEMEHAIAAGDWNDMFLNAGRVAHYMSDAAQPYHTTVNYNPQGPNGTYLHAVLDSSMADHISEIKIVNSTIVGNIAPIQNLTVFVLETARQSHYFLPIINRTLIDEGRPWSPELTSIVENRTNTAIIAVARVWYTAIVGANVTPPPVPTENALSISMENITLVSTGPSSIRLGVTDKLGVKTNTDVFLKVGNSTFRGQVANVFPPIGEYSIVFDSELSGSGTVIVERQGYQSGTAVIVLLPAVGTTTTVTITMTKTATLEARPLSLPPTALAAAVVFLLALIVLVVYRRTTKGN